MFIRGLLSMVATLNYFIFIVREWSDRYLAYKRNIKFLEKWRFISQHSLLLPRHTWFSDAITYLTRLKNTSSGGLQIDMALWRGGNILLIRLKFLTGEWFFKFGNKNKTEPNLKNTVDRVAVRILMNGAKWTVVTCDRVKTH